MADICPHDRTPRFCYRCQVEALPTCSACGRHAVMTVTCPCGALLCSRYCAEVIHTWNCTVKEVA